MKKISLSLVFAGIISTAVFGNEHHYFTVQQDGKKQNAPKVQEASKVPKTEKQGARPMPAVTAIPDNSKQESMNAEPAKEDSKTLNKKEPASETHKPIKAYPVKHSEKAAQPAQKVDEKK